MWMRARRLVLLLVAVVVVVALTSLCQTIALPWLLQRAILSRLAGIGFPEAELEVRSCSWRGAELANVSLDRDRRACVQSLSVTYSLRSLLRKKLKKLCVTGGELLLQIQGGQIVFGELPQMGWGANGAAQAPPFEDIELRACTLSILWGDERFCVPCQGHVRCSGGQWRVHDLQLRVPGSPQDVRATLHHQGQSLVFMMEGQDLDLRALVSALPTRGFGIPTRTAGRADIGLEGEFSKDEGRIQLRLEGTDNWLKTELTGQPIDAEGIDCRLRLDFGSDLKPRHVECNLVAEVLSCRDIAATHVRINLEQRDRRLCVEGDAQGEGWSLKRFEANLPADFGANGQENEPVTLTWDYAGRLPESISERLAKQGWDASGLGHISVAGSLAAAPSDLKPLPLSRFTVPNLRLTLSPGDLEFRDANRVIVRELSGQIVLGGHYEDHTWHVLVRPESSLRFGSADVLNVSAGQTTLSLAEDGVAGVREFSYGANGFEGEFTLEAVSDSIRVGEGDSAGTAAGDVGLLIDFKAAAGRATAKGTARASEVRLRSASDRWALGLESASLDLEADWCGRSDLWATGTLTLASAALSHGRTESLLAFAGDVLGPMDLSMRRNKDEGQFHVEWPLRRIGVLSAEGSLDLSEKPWRGSASLACTGVQLDREHPLAEMIERLGDLGVRGEVGLNAVVAMNGWNLTPHADVLLKDVDVDSQRHGIRLERVNGVVTLVGLRPPSTPGNQVIEVGYLEMGRLKMREGMVSFRLEDDPAAVFVETMDWGWLDGRVRAHAVRMLPDEPVISLPLFLDGVSLGKMLNLGFGASGTGEGTLYGHIPLYVNRSNLAELRLGNGSVYSTTGHGWWKLQDSGVASILRSMLDKQLRPLADGSDQATDRGRILNGLLDFEYNTLKIDLIRDEGDLVARVTTRGRSRAAGVPVEFEKIVLDFPGFAENLRKLLTVSKAVRRRVADSPDIDRE